MRENIESLLSRFNLNPGGNEASISRIDVLAWPFQHHCCLLLLEEFSHLLKHDFIYIEGKLGRSL